MICDLNSGRLLYYTSTILPLQLADSTCRSKPLAMASKAAAAESWQVWQSTCRMVIRLMAPLRPGSLLDGFIL